MLSLPTRTSVFYLFCRKNAEKIGTRATDTTKITIQCQMGPTISLLLSWAPQRANKRAIANNVSILISSRHSFSSGAERHDNTVMSLKFISQPSNNETKPKTGPSPYSSLIFLQIFPPAPFSSRSFWNHFFLSCLSPWPMITRLSVCMSLVNWVGNSKRNFILCPALAYSEEKKRNRPKYYSERRTFDGKLLAMDAVRYKLKSAIIGEGIREK